MKYPFARLGDYIDILSGFAYKSKDFVGSGIPVIKIKNVSPPYVTLDDLSYVTNEIAYSNPKYILSYDDVLIALTGSHINQMASVVGRVARVKYDTVTVLNQRVGKVIVPNPDACDLNYVYYFLSQDDVKITLASKAGGAANQANISPTDVKNLMLPFPDIDTQRRIADILSAYDDLIENNQKQIKLLEEAAQRLYKEWFVDLRFPGWEDAEIVDGVPEGWRKVSIDDLGEYINGYAFKPSDWGTTGKPIIKIKEMNEGISKDTPRNSGSEIPNKYLVSSGDILFSWSATLAVIIWHSEEGLLNQHLFKVVPNSDCGREFVFQSILFSLPAFHNLTTGATMKHLQRGKLKEALVLKPSQSIMDKFEIVANEYRRLILTLEGKNNLLTEARDRLLPKLMSGELEV